MIVAYKGEINANIIADTLGLIEAKLAHEMVGNLIRKKIYNVMVECLQNLYHHVDKISPSESEPKMGAFILSKTNDGYRIATGNLVRNDKSAVIKEKIDKINSLSKEELKEFYKFVLNNQIFSEKGGGGLGLIDIARKTGNKLIYEFTPYNDEYSFFNLSVLVSE